MFKNMKLSTKMGLGFGIIILIAGVLGFIGWNGVTQVRKHMVVYSEWGDIDMVMNEDVIQKYMHLDLALIDYTVSPDKNTLKALHEFETISDENAEVHVKWDELIVSCENMLEKVMEEVVDPAKYEAERARDIQQMIKWSSIDMVMSEAVISNVLKLQMAAETYGTENSADAWNAFVVAYKAAMDGMAEWRQTFVGEKELETTAKRVEALLTEYRALGDSFHKNNAKYHELAKYLDASFHTVLTNLENAMENVIDPAKEDAVAMAESNQQQAALMAMWLAVVGVVLGVSLAYFTTRSIMKPINQVIEGMTQSSEQVSSASSQISKSNQTVSQGASEQATSLEEVSSSLQEMASMTKQNAGNASQAREIAQSTRNSVAKGSESMKKMTEAISKIQTSSNETAKIIKTIDEIAFQTNLLALNAAVEAARAGDAGKGFAVVAEEVRNLALRSSEAAKNTSSLIEESQKNSENGVKVSDEVENLLKQIVEGVQKTTQLVGEVSTASDEQSRSIDQVNVAVDQMNQVTQSNTANAEESASASEELAGQAQELGGMVNVLTSIIRGTGGDGRVVMRRPAEQREFRRPQPQVFEAPQGPKPQLQSRIHNLLQQEGKQKEKEVSVTAEPEHKVKKTRTTAEPEKVIPLDKDEKTLQNF